MARHTQDSSHLLGRCLASAANAGPALTPPPFLACCVCWAKRTTVDHVLIWCLDIFPAVARHYTNSRRRVLNRCYFSVGSALVDNRRRWTNAKVTPIQHPAPTAKLSSPPSRRRVLNRCRFGVGSVSSIVDRRWTGVAFTALCLVGHQVMYCQLWYHTT